MVEGHGFAHVIHETLCLLKWKQKHFESHHGMKFIPHHGNNEDNGSLEDLRVNHNYNESFQKLKDGKNPTWCAT